MVLEIVKHILDYQVKQLNKFINYGKIFSKY